MSAPSASVDGSGPCPPSVPPWRQTPSIAWALVDPPDAQRWHSTNRSPGFASSRLESKTPWMPRRGRGENSWVMMDLGFERLLTAVRVTGCGTEEDQAVTEFKVRYSLDGERWDEFPQPFEGLVTGEALVERKFPKTVEARFLKIVVGGWRGEPALRVGVCCSPEADSEAEDEAEDEATFDGERASGESARHQAERRLQQATRHNNMYEVDQLLEQTDPLDFTATFLGDMIALARELGHDQVLQRLLRGAARRARASADAAPAVAKARPVRSSPQASPKARPLAAVAARRLAEVGAGARHAAGSGDGSGGCLRRAPAQPAPTPRQPDHPPPRALAAPPQAEVDDAIAHSAEVAQHEMREPARKRQRLSQPSPAAPPGGTWPTEIISDEEEEDADFPLEWLEAEEGEEEAVQDGEEEVDADSQAQPPDTDATVSAEVPQRLAADASAAGGRAQVARDEWWRVLSNTTWLDTRGPMRQKRYTLIGEARHLYATIRFQQGAAAQPHRARLKLQAVGPECLRWGTVPSARLRLVRKEYFLHRRDVSDDRLVWRFADGGVAYEWLLVGPPRPASAQTHTQAATTVWEREGAACAELPREALASMTMDIATGGYRYLAPPMPRADLEIDMRAFRDPAAGPLREHDGHHPEILSRLVRHPDFPSFIARVRGFVTSRLSSNGRHLRVLLCCNAGRHRSVAGGCLLEHIATHVGFGEVALQHICLERCQCRVCQSGGPEATAAKNIALQLWNR